LVGVQHHWAVCFLLSIAAFGDALDAALNATSISLGNECLDRTAAALRLAHHQP
jgi:hypothetical protein